MERGRHATLQYAWANARPSACRVRDCSDRPTCRKALRGLKDASRREFLIPFGKCGSVTRRRTEVTRSPHCYDGMARPSLAANNGGLAVTSIGLTRALDRPHHCRSASWMVGRPRPLSRKHDP